MKVSNILMQVAVLVWRPFLAVIAAMLLLYFVRPAEPGIVYGLVVLNLCVLIPTLIYSLCSRKPTPLAWAKLIGVTCLSSTILGLVIGFLGFLGIFGLLAILFVMAAYRIFQNWDLFDYTTTWGAKVVSGERVEFDLTKVNKIGGVSDERGEETDRGTFVSGGDQTSTGEPASIVRGDEINESPMPQLSEQSDLASDESQRETAPGLALSDVSVDVSKVSKPLRRRKRKKEKVEL